MEATRVIIFQTFLFAFAAGSGAYAAGFSVQKKGLMRLTVKSATAVTAVSGLVLFLFGILGAVFAGVMPPNAAEAGSLLLLCVLCAKRLFDIRITKRSPYIKTRGEMAAFLSADAVLAGFCAGLGGINIAAVVCVFILFNCAFLRLGKQAAESESSACWSVPSFGAVLFVVIAVL
jgi:hypothetical protein